nr:hypothetical protein [Microbacterium sp. MEJ108Y]
MLVFRVSSVYNRSARGEQLGLAITEALRSIVEDIGAVIDDMDPTGSACAHAEVVLFAVTTWKSLRIERSDLLDAESADPHAETVAGGNSRIHPHRLSAERARIGDLVDPRRQWILVSDSRRRERSGSVRHGGHCRGPRRVGGGREHAVEPSGCHSRVGVQEHDVVVPGFDDPPVHSPRESHVRLVGEDSDPRVVAVASKYFLHPCIR